MKVAFIGLGAMGYPMAGHQQQAGHDVCVYNRTQSKAERWVRDYGGRSAPTPATASRGADAVMICVGNDDDVRSVVLGDQGALAGLQPGAVIVDHTTTSNSLAEQIADYCKSEQVHFLDAPVSGGQSGAESGALAVMVGGDEEILSRVFPVLEPYAKSITLMGAVGAGQMTKMVNQLLIAGVLQGIAEGFTLATRAGLDLPKVIAAIADGAAGSWQLSNRGLSTARGEFDDGFAIEWMQKDLGFCKEAASQLGIYLPNAEYVSEQYRKLQQKGLHRCDTSVLIRQFDDEA